MSRRERRSVSLGRYRDRAPREVSRGPPGNEDSPEVSTRHNISNYLLTLQRLQASEDENQHLRKENELLRQRTRSSRLSSASFRIENSPHQLTNTTMSSSTTSSNGSGSGGGGSSVNNSNVILRDAEDEKIAADVKRNSLLFVGDALPATSVEHAALEAQYKKLQEDFETVKEFLKHLFQHALSMSSSTSSSSFAGNTLPLKGGNKADRDINSCSPFPSKQLERSLDDINGQISQLKSSQDQQQVRMEQVQQALDNVLCQSSVRNDVTMRIVRQSDKMKELSRQASFLESQLAAAQLSVRQAEEKSRVATNMGQDVEKFVSTNGRILKGNAKDELNKLAERLARLGKFTPTCNCKVAAINNLMNHVTASVAMGKGFAESRPPADVVDAMSKLERLIGSDWHRLGRMLGLPADTLEDVGKFTNFDLTSRVEKVVTSWARLYPRNACAEALKQGLEKMDRDALLLSEQPLCKEWQQLPPEIVAYVIAHIVDTPSLVTELCGHGVISADNRGFILGLPQEHRRASRLLHSVVYMGIDALLLWCAALDQLNQTQLATRVRGCLPSKQNSSSSYPAFLTLDLNNRPSSRLGKTTNVSASRHAQKDSGSKTLTSSSSFHSSSSSSATTVNHLQSSLNSSIVTSSSSKSTSPAGGTATPNSRPPTEKQQRKKRSRSLFTRKNKLRDTDPDPPTVDTADDVFSEAGFGSITPQAYYNYYHPGINVNVLTSSRESNGDRGRGYGERVGPGVQNDGDRGVASSGGVESHPWVRNPHHHQQSRPHSRHININSGADEVAV
ncbi:hypothetical protein PoB_003712200 [Plakobranchus ocellatus]|uniref:Death domain-containing protein n=1 Tax=Plakobranchus ocellatus TaxID=259542 RepID=A0AAV4AUG3_9GAST|nr:hypothetical protein PoB_003712200 [Plakobranchus ocellatus]